MFIYRNYVSLSNEQTQFLDNIQFIFIFLTNGKTDNLNDNMEDQEA